MIKDKDKLQYKLFEKCLAENKIDPAKFKITVDHQNGYITLNDTLKFELKYPLSYIKQINSILKDKKYDFCFVGHFEDKGRQELLEKYQNQNSYIENSKRGRDKSIKYDFDIEYYTILSQTKYSLVPNHNGEWYNHDNAWTYRFIETIFSKSVPVLFKETPLGKNFLKDFKYLEDHNFKELNDKEYQQIVDHNYNLALDTWTLTLNEINLIKNQ
jgi:hypothetical protein